MEETIFSYPTKKKIRKLLRLYDIDTTHIIFSDGYDSGTRGGMFWKRIDLKKKMIGIDLHFEKYNVRIARYKTFGEVHSIFFHKVERKI